MSLEEETSEEREARLLGEAEGYIEAFFERVQNAYDFTFPETHREKIISKATLAFGKHVTEYLIHPRTLDGYKLTAFLVYFAAQNINERVIALPTGKDPVIEICEAGLDRLSIIYLRETRAISGSALVIDEDELNHLAKMVYNEINRQGDIGLGPNGLGAVFTCRLKGYKDAYNTGRGNEGDSAVTS